MNHCLLSFLSLLTSLAAAEPKWSHLSSKNGELPTPGESTQQTGALVADLDRDGVNDFVLSFRQVAPALVWYRRTNNGWERYVIEKDFLTVEAGGAVYDIDGDGDADLVFGGDWQSKEVWWWENPYPKFDPKTAWKRHVIKKDGATQHHDQTFGDFKGAGQPQLAFWNQGAKTIFLADIPADPRQTEPWPCFAMFSGRAGERGDQGKFLYAEGMAAADIDATSAAAHQQSRRARSALASARVAKTPASSTARAIPASGAMWTASAIDTAPAAAGRSGVLRTAVTAS